MTCQFGNCSCYRWVVYLGMVFFDTSLLALFDNCAASLVAVINGWTASFRNHHCRFCIIPATVSFWFTGTDEHKYQSDDGGGWRCVEFYFKYDRLALSLRYTLGVIALCSVQFLYLNTILYVARGTHYINDWFSITIKSISKLTLGPSLRHVSKIRTLSSCYV